MFRDDVNTANASYRSSSRPKQRNTWSSSLRADNYKSTPRKHAAAGRKGARQKPTEEDRTANNQKRRARWELKKQELETQRQAFLAGLHSKGQTQEVVQIFEATKRIPLGEISQTVASTDSNIIAPQPGTKDLCKPVPQAKQPATENQLLPRRPVVKQRPRPVAAAGVVVGGLMRTPPPLLHPKKSVPEAEEPSSEFEETNPTGTGRVEAETPVQIPHAQESKESQSQQEPEPATLPTPAVAVDSNPTANAKRRGWSKKEVPAASDQRHAMWAEIRQEEETPKTPTHKRATSSSSSESSTYTPGTTPALASRVASKVLSRVARTETRLQQQLADIQRQLQQQQQSDQSQTHADKDSVRALEEKMKGINSSIELMCSQTEQRLREVKEQTLLMHQRLEKVTQEDRRGDVDSMHAKLQELAQESSSLRQQLQIVQTTASSIREDISASHAGATAAAAAKMQSPAKGAQLKALAELNASLCTRMDTLQSKADLLYEGMGTIAGLERVVQDKVGSTVARETGALKEQYQVLEDQLKSLQGASELQITTLRQQMEKQQQAIIEQLNQLACAAAAATRNQQEQKQTREEHAKKSEESFRNQSELEVKALKELLAQTEERHRQELQQLQSSMNSRQQDYKEELLQQMKTLMSAMAVSRVQDSVQAKVSEMEAAPPKESKAAPEAPKVPSKPISAGEKFARERMSSHWGKQASRKHRRSSTMGTRPSNIEDLKSSSVRHSMASKGRTYWGTVKLFQNALKE